MADKIQFDNLAGGIVGEQFLAAYQQILQNIHDPNTDPKKKRELNIKIIFESDETRELAGLSVQCIPKLAPSVQAFTKILMSKDEETGLIESKELNTKKIVEEAKLLAETPVLNSPFK